MRSNRGAIPVVVWAVLAVLGVGAVAVPNLNPVTWFKKDKIAEADKNLQQAQAELKKAQDDARTAQGALLASQKAERDKQINQIAYAQQMAAGASNALQNATQEPPVKLALSLLDRTNNGLAAAIGALPADKQAEIIKIVSDSLSGVQAKLDDAKAKLAEKDKELAVTTNERDGLKARIPTLEADLKAKDGSVATLTLTVAQKAQALTAVAEKVQAEVKENGSLGAQVDNLGRLLLVLGLIYVLAHYILPALSAEFPQVRLLQGINRTVTSFVSAHEIVSQSEPPKV